MKHFIHCQSNLDLLSLLLELEQHLIVPMVDR